LVIGILVYFFVIKKKGDKTVIQMGMESEIEQPPEISISEETDCGGQIERSVRERSVRESDCAGASTLERLQRLRDCN
jgi:hypothetical protein